MRSALLLSMWEIRDSVDFAFEYSILAKKAGDSDYTKIADHQKANRTDNYAQVYKFNAAQYSEVKIVMHSCKTQGGTQNGWPAVAEFEVYGSEIEVQDTGSIAFKKPVDAVWKKYGEKYYGRKQKDTADRRILSVLCRY